MNKKTYDISSIKRDCNLRSFWKFHVVVEQEKDREKEKVGGRPAKLYAKKGDRDLEREIKKGDIFCLKINMKIL